MNTIMDVKNITKIYGSRGVKYKALDGINLEINEGDFVAIMGPSGSGKTTMLNLLSTIDTPTTGEIFYKGDNILKLNKKALTNYRKEELGFIFQDFNLLDNMTIMDNIALPLALGKKNSKKIIERVKKISNFFGIDDQLNKYPYELSGGQKQRTAAARALITEPKLVLADEPTGALDSKSSADLLKSLVRMNEDFKTTVIMVTHDAFAASYCKRVLFLKDGKIHAKLDKDTSRKEFFQRIIDLMGALGGVQNECV
ncbi:ABC transporter ATP-binding protein [Oceanirhabdus sp. W0125-5]|uniref:ABC transporter ATP-binding protein n=1 Tax=Oceanirhabdus sp. W0125-5 TaxID=2999116 RepID=UPI0022F31F81|nr:ABC transporter ATP-binding protein [Oceanirhabdus sp. W0125-5]WBW96866.1 ABC transporter ATP-binding protein [Oceanirhabdus sp. W0125-5]